MKGHEAHIRRIVDAAPQLSDAQRAKLRYLLSPEEVAKASRNEQGLPDTVEDAAALHRVARIVGKQSSR